jgi:hypothetical protein
MEQDGIQNPQTRIIPEHLARLQALETASRKMAGPMLAGLCLPARVLIDFDPWAISMDISIRQLSLTAIHAHCSTVTMPRDADKLLSPGDACRIQFDSNGLPVPLLPARIESVSAEASAPGTLALRLKWLLDYHAESQLRKFLEALTNEKSGSLA